MRIPNCPCISTCSKLNSGLIMILHIEGCLLEISIFWSICNLSFEKDSSFPLPLVLAYQSNLKVLPQSCTPSGVLTIDPWKENYYNYKKYSRGHLIESILIRSLEDWRVGKVKGTQESGKVNDLLLLALVCKVLFWQQATDK